MKSLSHLQYLFVVMWIVGHVQVMIQKRLKDLGEEIWQHVASYPLAHESNPL